jgi:hypothetical protein
MRDVGAAFSGNFALPAGIHAREATQAAGLMLSLARRPVSFPRHVSSTPRTGVRRVKARFPSGRQSHPARVAPAGSNCSDEGGDEIVEAYDGKGH